MGTYMRGANQNKSIKTRFCQANWLFVGHDMITKVYIFSVLIFDNLFWVTKVYMIS